MSLSLAVFGDSIADGLGAKGRHWPVRLAEAIDANLVAVTDSAQTVTTSLSRAKDIEQHVDIAIVAHGTTEAIPRPTTTALRLMPGRWRSPGWMDPRPYYSSRRRRRVIEMAESGIRWRVKCVLMRGGTEQIVSIERFRVDLQALVNLLTSRGARVILVGPTDIDDRFFPGSSVELERYELAATTAAPELVSMRGRLDQWGDYLLDHFHPNAAGHGKMADLLAAQIKMPSRS